MGEPMGLRRLGSLLARGAFAGKQTEKPRASSRSRFRTPHVERLEERNLLTDLRAFYGAEGFGSQATGGRGGDVYVVTNLNASGAGSLRAGIEGARSSPRTIVFAVGGVIDLNGDRIRDTQGNLTIAGQTAPGGIAIHNGRLEFSNANNIVVRHVSVRWGRTGTDNEKDTIPISNVQNAIFDHISSSWGSDETLSLTNDVTNVTVQNSIIAEGIKSGHQYGSLINSTTTGGGRITLYGNLYTNLLGRMPRAASQNGQQFLLEMVNNVFYNWGTGGDWGTQTTATSNEYVNLNMVNNYHIAGPNSYGFLGLGNYHTTILHGGDGVDNVYLSGNKIDSNRNGSLDGGNAGFSNTQGSITQISTEFWVPTWAEIVNLRTADQALQRVIADVGSHPWSRDSVDSRLINELQSYGTQGSIKTSVPGWPSIPTQAAGVDTDKDGMPDSWETWYGTNPNVKNHNAVNNAIGYTDLEQYLQWIIDPSSIQPINLPPVAVVNGPYSVTEGQSVTFSAAGSYDPSPGQTITYAWDINGDGFFTDATGVNPTLSWAQLESLGIWDGPSARSVRVRVTDNLGASTTSAATTLSVVNAAPTAWLGGPNFGVRGQPFNYFLYAADPAGADQVTNFTFDIDWNGDGIVDQSVVGPNATAVSHVYAESGAYTIKLTATDKDGGTSAVYSWAVNVVKWTVTPDGSNPSLSNLVIGGATGNNFYSLWGIGPTSVGVVDSTGDLGIFRADGVTGKIIVFMQGGDDTLTIEAGMAGFDVDAHLGNGFNQFAALGGGNAAYTIHGGADIDQVFIVGQGSIATTFHGGEGDDLYLDVSGHPTNSATVLGQGGNDGAAGGGGPDSFNGGSGNDLLVGFGGNDTLLGGDGDDFLVGGDGADSLDGGSNQDLLVAGSLVFLPEATDGYVPIWDEWRSGAAFATRVSNVSGTSGGSNDPYFIIPGDTALNDGVVDSLLGGANEDWLVYDFALDLAPDFAPAMDVRTSLA